ncbi:MAG: zf-TFIIB domain-containing protein [Melioribacteraceae bacterium]|nr:zf-TFIIB domain-containing protein [Melioribacteraceae bacterium]
MHCPRCENPLIILEINEIEIDYCTDCQGIWLDSGELELLLDDSEKKDLLLKSFKKYSETSEAKLKCPICSKKMQKILVDESEKIIIDECPNLHGLWFDKGELLELVEKGSLDKENQIIKLLRDMFKYKINQTEE